MAEQIKRKYLTLDAFGTSYLVTKNKKIFNIAELMDKIYDFFVTNTSFSKEYVRNVINENLFNIEIPKEYDNNATGMGYYDSTFKELSIKDSMINNLEFERLLRHEFTHLLGSYELKKGDISGYSTKPTMERNCELNQEMTEYKKSRISFNLKKMKMILMGYFVEEKNVQFNEACVEMFARKDESLTKKNLKSIWNMDIDIYTNFSEGSLYIFNANLVRQMTIARGVIEEELFEGLFDYGKAKKVMNRFNIKNFNSLSKGMDNIGVIVRNLADTEYDSEEEKTYIDELKAEVSKNEIQIIDKMLLPRIAKMKDDEKHQVLEQYYKLLIIEKEYFQSKTGYKPTINNQDTDTKQFKEYLQVDTKTIQPQNKKVDNTNEQNKDNSIEEEQIKY